MKHLISEQVPLCTKSYLLTLASNFFVMMGISMLMSTLPLYAKALGGSNVMAGLVVGIYALSSLLCRPFVGLLLDTRGRKPLLVGGGLILLASFMSFHLAASVAALLLIRVVQGTGFSAQSTAAGTIVSDVVPASRLAEGLGYYGISITLPTAFGPSLGLELIGRYGYDALFNAATGFAAAGLVLMLGIGYEKRRPPARSAAQKAPTPSLIEKSALLPGLVMFFIALGLAGIITFLPQFAAERRIEGIGTYFTFYAAALIAARLFSGKVADQAGSGWVIYPGVLMVIASFVVLSFARSLPVSLVSAVLFGLGFGSVQPAMNAIAIQRVRPERKGAASAVFIAAMDIGMAVGSIAWGALSEQWGFALVYLFCASSAVLSLIVYVIIARTGGRDPSVGSGALL